MMVPTGVSKAKVEMKKYVIAASCDFSGHLSFYIRWDWLDKALVGKEGKVEALKLRKLL